MYILFLFAALVLKTKVRKSFQSHISVGDVIFSVFFQLDVYKPPEKVSMQFIKGNRVMIINGFVKANLILMIKN